MLGTKSFSLHPISITKKLFLLAVALPHLSRLSAWKTNQKNPKLVEETSRSNHVFATALSPYLNKKWGLQERLCVIEQHYQSVGSFAQLLSFAPNQYFDLIQFDEVYPGVRVVIDKPDWMRVEGEAVISFFHNEHRIHRLVFSIIKHLDTHVIAVGGVQGWGGTETIGAEEIKEMNVQLTKLLHGLHPKIFLLYMLKMLGAAWGISEIWGVSDANHRSNHRLVKSEKFSSYDKFWLDHSGVQNAQGFFVIPTEIKQKSHDEMPANKRARFKRRYEMLDQIRVRLNEVVENNQRVLKEHMTTPQQSMQEMASSAHHPHLLLLLFFVVELTSDFI